MKNKILLGCAKKVLYYVNYFSRDYNQRGRLSTPRKYSNINDLVKVHFKEIANHPCKRSLELALSFLNHRPANIIETGSSAYGTNSTVLFDSYVSSFGGTLDTVDIRLSQVFKLKKDVSCNTTLHCNDSKIFLQKFNIKNPKYNTFIYLDSWDVVWNEPIPAMVHCLNEFIAINQKLKRGDIILIDDTPLDYEVVSDVQGIERAKEFETFFSKTGIKAGKGTLVLEFCKRDYDVLYHDYQLLIQKR